MSGVAIGCEREGRPQVKPAGGEPAGLKLAWRVRGDVSYQVMPFNPATRQLVPLPYAAWISSANFLRA